MFDSACIDLAGGIGRFSKEQSGSCTQCSSNQFAPAGSASCASCPPGHFKRGVACSKCPAGQFMDKLSVVLSPKCLKCERGQFQMRHGMVRCIKCERGYYSLPARTACHACRAGKYSAVFGVGGCAACPPGTSSDSAAGSCKVPNGLNAPCRPRAMPARTCAALTLLRYTLCWLVADRHVRLAASRHFPWPAKPPVRGARRGRWRSQQGRRRAR